MDRQHFTIRLADLTIRVTGDFAYPESCRSRCKDYLIEDTEPDLAVTVTEEEIVEQCRQNQEFTREYLEYLCIHRAIAEKLPYHHRLVFHGAVITYKDKCMLFTAPSGTGKTTHISLWRKYLGKDVDIVNGDKPMLWVDDEGAIAYGTPWCGKEGWQKNRKARLSAICFVRRGEIPKIRRADPIECLEPLMHQVFLPLEDTEGAGRTLEDLDRLVSEVPLYILECDISEESVKCAFAEIVGESYPGKEV